MKDFNINSYIYANITIDDIFITKKKKSSTLDEQSDSQPDSQPQSYLQEDSQCNLQSTSQPRIRTDNEILRVLREKTVFKYAKSFPSQQIIYLFDPDNGHYFLANQPYIVSLLSKIFHHCLSLNSSKPCYPSHNTLERLEKLLRVDFHGILTPPMFDQDYLIMDNGALNFKTLDLVEKTPDIFQITAVFYPFNSKATCNKFLNFLDVFCDSKEDRKLFIRSYMWAALTGYYEDQTFMALIGPGGTGKSQLTNILTAVIGTQNCITTSLRDLAHDKFETPLLIDKRLIVISDHEYYKGDTSVMKQLIGGDVARGRKKNAMEIKDLRCFAKFIVVGNSPIASFDSGGAMSRRQVAIPACNISESREDLLGFDKNNLPKGLLKDEIPGIAYWALSMDPDKAKSYLTNRSLLVSLTQSLEEIEFITNPIKAWIKDELEPGSECPVGFIPHDNSIQAIFEAKRRHLLFPIYMMWCKKHNISQSTTSTSFKKALLENLSALGYKGISYYRKTTGMYVGGIQIQQKVFNVDSSYGGEVNIITVPDNDQTNLSTENPTNLSTENPTNLSADNPQEQLAPFETALKPASAGVNQSKPYNPELCSDKEMHSKAQDGIEKYISLLGKSTIKLQLNRRTKTYLKENKGLIVDKLVQDHLNPIKNPTEKYKTAIQKRCNSSLISMISFGPIPYTYVRSDSHRRTPINSSMSALRAAKQVAYSFMAEQLNEQDCTILQFDMRSCYPSILAGMYPQQLPQLCYALKTGLWKSLKDWYQQEDKGHLFSEQSIKSCVHAAYFQSGEQKLMDIFLENMAQEQGMLMEEFNFNIDYMKYRETAGNAIETLKRNPLLCELRNITNNLSYEFDNRLIYGPSGYACNFHKGASFVSDFALLMQSYEITIIAFTGLLLKEEYPEIEMLEHHHDGFSIIAPQDKRFLIIESCNKNLEKVRESLGLSDSLKFKHNDLSII